MLDNGLQGCRDSNDVRPVNIPDSRDVIELECKEMNLVLALGKCAAGLYAFQRCETSERTGLERRDGVGIQGNRLGVGVWQCDAVL